MKFTKHNTPGTDFYQDCSAEVQILKIEEGDFAGLN